MRIRKPNITGAVAGYDLGSQYAQISYCLPGTDKPETVSSVAGQEEYLIPALLARSIDSHNWLFGREAQEAVQKGEAYPVKELLSSAAAKKTIQVEEESFDSIALLSLFIRKTLTLLTPILPSNKLQGFVFSVEKVTGEIAEALKQAVILLELKVDQVFVIGRAESFFYYNISQPEELWLRDVLLCDLSRDVLRTYLFHANRKTTPVASFVDETVQEEVQPFIPTGDEAQDHRNGMKLDRKFAAVVSEILDKNQVSSVYLIGSGFEGEWYQESLPILCKDRRVFLGNNLFSKGACYAAMERLFGGISKGYAFLGNDMIQANVGMCVQKGKRCLSGAFGCGNELV